jgi:hypothetical protein
MMSIKETDYKNFGKCVELSGGGVKALVTVGIGPRVIYYGTDDGRNVFFEDISREVRRSGAYFDENFKDGETWYLYGGHRVWKSPEDDATYIPDNYPVEYEIKQNHDRTDETIVFTQNIQKNTGLRFRLEVSMDQKGGLKIRHIMENLGEKAVAASIWGISVLKGGGFLAVPLNTDDTGFLPNNNFSFWPYDDMRDERLSFVRDYLVLKHDANAERPFKIGLNCRKQAALYHNDGLVFVKKFDWQDGAYPDGNCNFESYTSGLITELETLSPIFSIEPNQSAEHTEEFSVFERDLKPDEKSLDEFFKSPL